MRTNTEVRSCDWFGKLPIGWEMRPLKSLFDFSKGLSITKADLIEQGEPVVSYGQIHSKANECVALNPDLIRHVPANISLAAPKARCQKGGFIFADTSEDIEGCGNCVRISIEFSLQGGYHTIVLNPKTPGDTKYLAYLFLTDAWRSQIRRDLVDVKLFSVNQEKLKETYIVVPSSAEQRRIVEFLDERCAAVDADIAKRRKIIEKLGEYKKAVITRAVTKGLDPNAEMKDSGVEWIGEVPADWHLAFTGMCFTEEKRKNSALSRTLTLQFCDGAIVPKAKQPSSQEDYEDIRSYRFADSGEIVINNLNLNYDLKSKRVGIIKDCGVITSAYIVLKPCECIVPAYANYLFKGYDACKAFHGMGIGLRQTLNWAELKNTNNLCPLSLSSSASSRSSTSAARPSTRRHPVKSSSSRSSRSTASPLSTTP